ncbi:MAG: N-6 DNA methylase [Syntrophales bacterium]|jgi:type I restriction-modification system DNA methylase subunit/predicted type IV restriction endonuclease|nr:Eco57I restriction-modification methylase domain-containing protein [Syntrophales bacterium]
MNAPDRVKQLVEIFDNNLEEYKRGSYNETQTRREFIDPFFEELGWDITNKQGYAEAYKDVIHEDAVKVGGVTKAPDYCFRIGGARKFFLEAKKPSVNIQEETNPAYQLRRYGWSAKLPLSILTDFEDFAVYDCRFKPLKTDKVSHSRILILRYTDYIDRWEEIAGIFSREAILKGSFDKYVESKKIKKGTTEVDAAFLQEIEQWRELLARNIALRNPSLTQRELNYAVQQTIDRIVFLRICEDRGIETYGGLMALRNGEHVYQRLFQLFNKADDKYNSGLFHFKKEKDRETFDNLTPNLQIDDKPLKEIFKNLYYPESPYEFSVLPADILGQVYEKFLGKVIRLTSGHQAKIEEKPEVRKAGGVYYTPAYIVDYIVKNTVGKLVEGKKPGPRGGVSHLKILDPACGSGSFLIGAYQFLLDWHRDAYINDGPENWDKGKTPRIYLSPKGEWRLTTDERKRILLNNIYGVDIDHQAVEVTKLSLLLKVLEGEDEQSIGKQMRLFHERVLPDLSKNIKCGNSLIGPDFYDHQQLNLFVEEEIFRINAFDWNTEFAEIMKNGGFDAVIGNPPYVRIQGLKEWAPTEVEFYKQRYKSAGKGNYDIYVVFVERALQLLNKQGKMGYILPHKFFQAQYGEPLRNLIAGGKHLAGIVHFGDQQVFNGATTYTCLMFLSKTPITKCHLLKVGDLGAWNKAGMAFDSFINGDQLSKNEWNFIVGSGTNLFAKLSENQNRLGSEALRIFQGFKTGSDSVFILDVVGKGIFASSCLKCEVHLENKLLHPLFKSGHLKRYNLHPTEKVILFPYRDGALISWTDIETSAPRTAEYLMACKQTLEQREGGKWSGKFWYCFSRTQALKVMSSIKILTADLNPHANYCLDSTGSACFTGGAAGGYGIVLPEEKRIYILGLLNSKLLDWYLQKISSTFRGGWFSYESRFISKLPIRTINFADPADVALHDQMVSLVEQMLELNKKLPESKVPQTTEVLKRQIDATDRQIDQLVYRLYDLTEEEIKIVESEAGSV